MSKYSTYMETLNAFEEMKRRVESLKQDPEVNKVIDFQNKLVQLMDQHGVSKADVLQMWGIDAKPAGDKERKSGKGGTRPLKVYKNPNSGEVVKTKGGNHKVLNAWREQYGKETVDSWLQK